MKIAIIGVGGVGAYIGANLLLSQNKHEITLIARGLHKEKIQSSGLKIIEDDNEFIVHVKSMELEGIYDVVILAVKSYDLADSINMISTHVDKKSIVFSLSNGVEHAKTIQNSLDVKVLDATVYILSHIQEAGVIRKKGKVFSLVIGSQRYKEEVLIIENLFKEANLRIKISENIQEALWKKYLFISVFATLTSYYNKSIKSVYEENIQECNKLLHELVNVAKAKGIDLSADIQKALDTASKLPQDASSSMHLDFQNNHKNELETLTHYIIQEGLNLHVKTPLYEKMYHSLKKKSVVSNMKKETALLGGGCFWCIEGVYNRVNGVISAVSGYAGGKRPNPNYEMICTGVSGYAEVVQIEYDSDIISYEEILEIFFEVHNPTTLNAQGADRGTQYRSVIYYYNEEQKTMAKEYIEKKQKDLDEQIVTELSPTPTFYKAEKYHQDYYSQNPNQGYCAMVVAPKIQKFMMKFPSKIK